MLKQPPLKTKSLGNEFLGRLFETRDQAHYLHFQTLSYAEHKALNKFFDELIELTDNFFECYQGKYGRIRGGFTIKIHDYPTSGSVKEWCNSLHEYICAFGKSVFSPDDAELQNILDEITALIDKTTYLLSLK